MCADSIPHGHCHQTNANAEARSAGPTAVLEQAKRLASFCLVIHIQRDAIVIHPGVVKCHASINILKINKIY